MRIEISPIADVNILNGFDCGNNEMNKFLLGGFQDSINNHYCRSFIVTSPDFPNEIMAVFALSFDSLDLDTDDKEELMTGISTSLVPDISFDYEETFLAKRRYPAMEITYLAVNVNHQREHIGRAIVEEIADIAIKQKIAGCQFLTVEALKSGDSPAVPFYYKCNFVPNELPDPNKDTLRMFRTLYVTDRNQQ